jgi:hypothetical protein
MKWSLRIRRRRAVALAISACMLIVGVPTAAAATWEDLRSPDAKDAAREAGAPPAPPSSIAASAADQYRDLRSPDARDAALSAQQSAQPAATRRDLRSPDARDAARGITTGSVAVPASATVERRTVVAVEENGSQTLAIVFSACALLVALLSVGFVAVSRRPRPRWTAP